MLSMWKNRIVLFLVVIFGIFYSVPGVYIYVKSIDADSKTFRITNECATKYMDNPSIDLSEKVKSAHELCPKQSNLDERKTKWWLEVPGLILTILLGPILFLKEVFG